MMAWLWKTVPSAKTKKDHTNKKLGTHKETGAVILHFLSFNTHNILSDVKKYDKML